MPYETLEPYAVEPDDKATIGRILHAAGQGDPRARLTIRQLDKAKADAAAQDRAELQRRSNESLKRGADLFDQYNTAKHDTR